MSKKSEHSGTQATNGKADQGVSDAIGNPIANYTVDSAMKVAATYIEAAGSAVFDACVSFGVVYLIGLNFNKGGNRKVDELDSVAMKFAAERGVKKSMAYNYVAIGRKLGKHVYKTHKNGGLSAACRDAATPEEAIAFLKADLLNRKVNSYNRLAIFLQPTLEYTADKAKEDVYNATPDGKKKAAAARERTARAKTLESVVEKPQLLSLAARRLAKADRFEELAKVVSDAIAAINSAEILSGIIETATTRLGEIRMTGVDSTIAANAGQGAEHGAGQTH